MASSPGAQQPQSGGLPALMAESWPNVALPLSWAAEGNQTAQSCSGRPLLTMGRCQKQLQPADRKAAHLVVQPLSRHCTSPRGLCALSVLTVPDLLRATRRDTQQSWLEELLPHMVSPNLSPGHKWQLSPLPLREMIRWILRWMCSKLAKQAELHQFQITEEEPWGHPGCGSCWKECALQSEFLRILSSLPFVVWATVCLWRP